MQKHFIYTALLEMLDPITDALDNKKVAVGIFTDLYWNPMDLGELSSTSFQVTIAIATSIGLLIMLNLVCYLLLHVEFHKGQCYGHVMTFVS